MGCLLALAGGSCRGGDTGGFVSSLSFDDVKLRGCEAADSLQREGVWVFVGKTGKDPCGEIVTIWLAGVQSCKKGELRGR